jgi:hypothetical protein
MGHLEKVVKTIVMTVKMELDVTTKKTDATVCPDFEVYCVNVFASMVRGFFILLELNAII